MNRTVTIGLTVYAMTVEVMHLVLHLPEPWFGRWPLRWSALARETGSIGRRRILLRGL